MPAGKPGSRSYILKDNRARLYKAAGGDGTVLAIEDGRLRAGIGHSAALSGLHTGLGVLHW